MIARWSRESADLIISWLNINKKLSNSRSLSSLHVCSRCRNIAQYWKINRNLIAKLECKSYLLSIRNLNHILRLQNFVPASSVEIYWLTLSLHSNYVSSSWEWNIVLLITQHSPSPVFWHLDLMIFEPPKSCPAWFSEISNHIHLICF